MRTNSEQREIKKLFKYAVDVHVEFIGILRGLYEHRGERCYIQSDLKKLTKEYRCT